MNNNNCADYEKYLSMSEEELFTEFGKSIEDSDTEILAFGDHMKKAKDWIDSKRERIILIICDENNWPKIRKTYSKNEDIVGFISSCLTPKFPNVNVIYLAVILVKRGLDELCECYD